MRSWAGRMRLDNPRAMLQLSPWHPSCLSYTPAAGPCCAWSSYARHFTEEKQVSFVSRAEVHSITGGTMEETTREEFVESSWVFERGKDEEYLCVLREQDQPLAEDWLVWLQRELSRQTRNPDTTWSALARKWRACAILPCCSTWYPCYKCLWDLDRSWVKALCL